MTKSVKRGSIIIETAIFLPIFIISVVTLLYIIKMIYWNECTYHCFSNEMRVLAAESYLAEKSHSMTGLPNGVFGLITKNHIMIEENMKKSLDLRLNKEIKEFSISNFKYLYSQNGISDQINISLKYKIIIRVPAGFIKDAAILQTIHTRAWTGKTIQSEAMGFSKMEEEEIADLVWIFPRAGEKYHKATCSVIESYPTPRILTDSIKKKMKACPICNSKNIPNGALVYCFLKTGKSYHCGDCPLIDRYTISMEKEQAVKEGFQPCEKCGGEK
jgi:hypothetical protein